MFLLFDKETKDFCVATQAPFGLNTYDAFKVDDYDRKFSYSLIDGSPVKGERLLTIEDSPDILAKIEATKYQIDRKVEYDKLNQFELQYDDSLDGGTRWKDAIQAIKDKYPKP